MSSLGLRALPTSKSDMASLALEGKALSSYSFFFKNSSCHILQSKDSDWPHATCHSIPGATLCRISSVEGNRKICGKKLRISSQKSRQVVVHAEGKGSAGGDSENVEQSGKATVEKGQKFLSMQQELLDQISERKKLIASLKDNIEKSAGQVRGYRGYNAPKKDTVGRSGEQMRADNDLLMKNGNGKPAEEASANGSYDALATSGSKSLTSRASSQSKVSSKETIDGIKVGQAGLGTPTKSGGGSPSLPPFESSTTPIATPKPTPKPALKPSSPLPNSSVVAPSAPRLVPRGLEKKPTETEKEKPPKAPVLEALKDASTAEVVEKSPPPVSANAMNIILVAAECAPWSKTGGLGDVAGALPKALARCGHRVMVVSPRYAEYREAIDMGVQNRYKVDGQDFEVRYYHVYIDGVDYVFLGSSMFIHLGNDIYRGSREDVLKRMVLLCKAAVEVPWHVPCGGICYGDGNLVFIANDWHTALLPVYLQAYYRDQGLMKFTRSVLIIHNIAHQGRGPMTDFRLLGLPEHYKDKFRLYDPVGGEHMNVFMAGLMRAHRIVAVSHGYAWECQTMDGGWGLHGIIQENAWKLRGIVNGIDNKDWNPELDIFLQSDGYENYTLESLETGKAACKAALQKELRLPVRSDVPLIGFIGRLDYQKGVDIIAEAMPWLMEQDLQLVMLGSGRQDLEVMLRSFEGQYRDKARGWVGFSVQTAHRITAGVDILLMPSRFEPCGLNQLYSMKYGTIPVVHAVGGLKDTVQGFDPFNNTGTGWTFEKANSAAMIHALGNALWTYRDFKESWVGIQKRGMTQDLSWDKAAKQYEEVLLAAKFQW